MAKRQTESAFPIEINTRLHSVNSCYHSFHGIVLVPRIWKSKIKKTNEV